MIDWYHNRSFGWWLIWLIGIIVGFLDGNYGYKYVINWMFGQKLMWLIGIIVDYLERDNGYGYVN